MPGKCPFRPIDGFVNGDVSFAHDSRFGWTDTCIAILHKPVEGLDLVVGPGELRFGHVDVNRHQDR